MKTFACSVTRALLFIEVKRDNEGMKHIKYEQELGATAAYTTIMMEASTMICQKYRKGGRKDCFLFDIWLASNKAAEAAMEVAKLIGVVKTNTKGFCKEIISNITKYWPGGSYLMLRRNPMVPGDRHLIAIGYNYNARKVLSFIITENAGSKHTGIPYLYKYTNQFTNVAIRPVACPLVM